MSELQSYNLLYARWIPVSWGNHVGKVGLDSVGIMEAIQCSPDIRCISHSAPFIEFGLYRLLITIVLDAYIVSEQRPTIGKMRKMLERGAFDHSIIDRYLSNYSASFDLWNPQEPFLQIRSGDNKGKQKPIITLFPAIPSGVNVTHWHHSFEKEATVSQDTAAQLLTTVSPFNFKTKPGDARTLAGDPPMYAVAMGKNLFETIVLNLPRPNGRVGVNQELYNGPIWRTRLDLSRLPRTPTAAQGFTWPVRAIELEDQGELVAKAINRTAYKKPTSSAITKGENVYDGKFGWRDPSAGIETSCLSINHIKARQGLPIWRDAVPLFLIASEGDPLRAQTRRSRPEVVSNALRLLEAPRFSVAVYGMRKKGGGAGDVKVEEWFRSLLTVPTEVARDTRLSHRAIGAFKTTQDVADALRTALRMLSSATAVRKNAAKKTHRDEGNALAAFWQRLESVLSYSYLEALVSNDVNAEENLRADVAHHARAVFQRAIGPHLRTADGLFRIANASNWFERKLASLLPRVARQSCEEDT